MGILGNQYTPIEGDTSKSASFDPPTHGPPSSRRARSKDREEGTAQCPSCNGHGKVPKEQERHLVALIPADDDRLKPSRTKTYVLAAIVISFLFAFMTIFFIYPRSFDLQSPYPEPELFPKTLYINTSLPNRIVKFTVENWWILVNPNYYPIKLKSLNVQAYLNKLVSENLNDTAVAVPFRSRTEVYITMEITFKDDLEYLVKFCNDPRSWVHTIYMRFQATASVTIMGYSFTKIAESYQRVSCGIDSTTTTSKPLAPTPAQKPK